MGTSGLETETGTLHEDTQFYKVEYGTVFEVQVKN